MKIHVYSIFDSKSGIFSRPWFAITEAVARRQFAELANDAASEVCRHSADFSLFYLGLFDDSDGAFTNNTVPENLGLSAQYKKEVVNENAS